jgi:hypothetical protein
MATDWSARTAALEYFEKALKNVKRGDDDEMKELLEQAVNALRRSQDHTAIQNKLNAAMDLLRDLKGVFAGDAAPHWVQQYETTMIRGQWLDRIDAVLPAQGKEGGQ